MKARKITMTYLVTYLAIGGIGLTFFPDQILELFLSNGDYGDIMPRMVGMFMCALSILIYKILKNEDWKYYVVTIYIRSFIVAIMCWLYFKSKDPLFLVLNGIVLVGLIPSIFTHLKNKNSR